MTRLDPGLVATRKVLFAVWLTAAFVSGCASLGQREVPADERFGSRVEGRDAEGRETIVIVPPDEDRTWSTYPAVFESLTVRPEAPAPDGSPVSVEILVKGAFPDACTELHEVNQDRTGNLIDVRLDMRRPQGAVCAAVLRPYRFYLLLDGTFPPGAYSLKLNDRSFPFEIRVPAQN